MGSKVASTVITRSESERHFNLVEINFVGPIPYSLFHTIINNFVWTMSDQEDGQFSDVEEEEKQ